MTLTSVTGQPTRFQSQFLISIPPIMSGVENTTVQRLYQNEVAKTVSLLQKLWANSFGDILMPYEALCYAVCND